MSEVKRYVHKQEKMQKISRFYGPNSERQYVQSADYDAAQSELAALREELAQAAHMRTFWAESAAELDKRLASADQRNSAVPTISAEQYEGLNDFFLSVCCDSGHRMDKPMVASLCEVGALESCGFGKHRLTKFGEYLLAQAQPTESGASES